MRRPGIKPTVQSAGVLLVLLCTIANILSHADRQMPIILVELVKSDLGLSDTEFGLLQGLAFSICYSFFTVILAQYADHYSRTRIIALSIFIWSASTLLCGFAESYASFFAARMGIGLGQALLSPAVYSLLASSYPRAYLGKVTACYASGAFIGNAVILVAGGILADLSIQSPYLLFPGIGSFTTWRLGFVIAGSLGIAYALIFLIFSKDTPHIPTIGKGTKVSLTEVLKFLSQHRHTMSCYIIGFSLSSMAMFTLIVWGPAYFIRVHRMDQAAVGFMLACMYVSANFSGVLLSGWLVDRLHTRGVNSAPFLIAAGAALATSLCLIPFVMAEELIPAAVTFFLAAHFSSYPISPAATANQLLAPVRMRARIYATFLCINNLTAMSIGVALVGLFNDLLFKSPHAVGTSLALTAGSSALAAAAVLYLGRGYYVRTVSVREQLSD